jgi:DNA-3-methyladenine glycosylase II
MSAPRRLDAAALQEAVQALCAHDAALAALVARDGTPPLWPRPEGFVTLARIILEQQVSLESAASLFRRLDASIEGGVHPRSIVALGADGLRALGVTRQKAAYWVALAEQVVEARLDLAALASFPDDDVLAHLQRVPGIGPWTANVYLLFALGRPDAWPPGDLALHMALRDVRGLDRVPTSNEAQHLASRWAPHRATAARILWQAYLRERGRRTELA